MVRRDNMTKTFCDVCGRETKKIRRILFPTSLDNIDSNDTSEVATYCGANLVLHTIRDVCPICDSMISAMEDKFFEDVKEQSLFFQDVESRSE
jgi:hypothetical protein